MSRHNFTPGQRLLVGERAYFVERELNPGVMQLRDEATNTFYERTIESLHELFSEGQLRFLNDLQTESYTKSKYEQLQEADISMLAPKTKAELDRRIAYVKGAKEIGVTRLTKDEFGPIVNKISETIGDSHPPSPIQVYKWYSGYKKSAEDVRALIPRHHKKGNKMARFSPELSSIIDSKIREKYLTIQRLSINDVYEFVVADVGRQNNIRPKTDQLHIPCYDAIKDRIHKLDPYEIMKAREGKLKADRMYRPSEHHPQPTYPLERVEIDHTKLDLFVVDVERRMPIGRPWQTSALDVFSRTNLGFSTGFVSPSYLSIKKCLKHAITPKSYVEKQYPGINHKWDCYGIPDLLIVDNGPELVGNNLANTALQLGINIQFAPVKLPWYKGAKERFFGTLNTKLLHSQPGTTFSNIFDKMEYDPQKNAIIDMPTFRWILHKWIIDVYHRAPNKGLAGIPALVWEKGIKLYPPAMPRDLSELNILLGMTAERKINKNGIELHGIFYNDWSLNKFRREMGKDGKVTVKYDPEELSVIYVWDALKMKFIPVLAVDQEYTRGLTLWQHEVIKRFARENIKKDFNLTDLCIAKAEIQEIVEDAWKKSKRSGTRVRMAKWLGDSLESGYGKIERDPVKKAVKAPANNSQEIDSHLVESAKEKHFANGISMIGTVVSNPAPPSGPADSLQGEIIRDLSVATPVEVGKKGESKRKGQMCEKKGNDPLANQQDQSRENEEDKKDLDLTNWDVGYLNH